MEDIWEFISNPRNLQEITPDHMGFKITTANLPERIYPGMMVGYKVSPLLGIRMTWVTEITQVQDGKYFVDEQRIGPYALWHHEHFIEPAQDGVLMKDLVTYRLPLGFLGTLAHRLFVKKQLNGIFGYRKTALEKRFGTL